MEFEEDLTRLKLLTRNGKLEIMKCPKCKEEWAQITRCCYCEYEGHNEEFTNKK